MHLITQIHTKKIIIDFIHCTDNSDCLKVFISFYFIFYAGNVELILWYSQFIFTYKKREFNFK